MATQSTLAPFYRGDTKVFNLSFKDSAGQPINLTGHELWFTMKKKESDKDDNAIIQKRVVFPAGSESEQGIGTFTLSSAESRLIAPDTYFYDIQKVIPENPPVVSTVMSGRISVRADITRNDGS